MAVYFWCVVVAWVVIYLSKAPVAAAMHRAGGYDNHHPRAQQAELTGWGQRALAAHMNGFEGFPPFAAAVVIAHLNGVAVPVLNGLAIAFVVFRIAYVVCYLADWAFLRSTVWTCGWLATLALFLAPLR